jgi:hypothetical protein
LQPPRQRIEHRRQWRPTEYRRQRRRIAHRRRRRVAGQAIARFRENGGSVLCRRANIHRQRLLRSCISRVAADIGAKVGAKIGAKACPAERQTRVRTHGARSQPMQQAFHGATIER